MKNLTSGNIYKTFILFAIPLVLSMLLTQTYNMVDTVIAGKYLGEKGLAAIGATSSLLSFISSIFSGYLSGFGIYLAKLFGAGEYERIRRGAYMNTLVCSLAAVCLSAIMIIFHNPIFDALNVNSDIRGDVYKYFSIYMSGFFLFQLAQSGALTLGALGDSFFPFIMSLISAVINVVGNIFSVTILNAGIIGIAVSSVVSAGAVGICYIIRFSKCINLLIPIKAKFKPNFTEIKKGLPYSLTTVLQQAAMFAAGLVLSPLINLTGSAAIAAYVVTSRILDIHNSIYQVSLRTVSSYASQCLGTNFSVGEKQKMLKKGVFVGYIQANAFVLVVLVLCLMFPRFIAELFFSGNGNTDSLELVVHFIRVFLPFVLFNVVNSLFHAFFRGVKAMNLLIISTAFSSAVRIAISIPLTKAYGINGFYTGMVVAWILEAIFIFTLYKTNIWLPKELKIQKSDTQKIKTA